ncbi:MAG: farnesyl diphosphate synthase [Myxococcota bacterium]|jgi:farnesyl diphosphate synthase
MSIRLLEKLDNIAKLVEKKMEEILPRSSNFSDSELVSAMNYSASTKGKRIRPFLTLITANIFGVKTDSVLDVAAILEFIHIYSLIHDDLPAMDDDDFRRGQPSCHKKFDEATAILAGDSLLTFAFETLSSPQLKTSPEVKCQLIHNISRAIGFEGMAGGQMMDLEAQNKELNQEQIFKLHHLKTGKLFIAAIEAGAILGSADKVKRSALINYGETIGLAFQIKDDLLDFFEEKINPRTKPDAASIVGLIGENAALEKLNLLEEQAICDLEIFGSEADLLRDLAKFIVSREI